MLEYCEIGVAMENGGPEILAMADLVTDDVEADGLYKAFDKLGLLKQKKLSSVWELSLYFMPVYDR